MRVGHRLFIAVLPAVLGVVAMAGLAYWGQRGRQVPEWVLAAGLLAAAASLAMAWRNTRYVARRIEALHERRGSPYAEGGSADELDLIERTITAAEERGDTRERAAEALVREYAGLLADASATVGRKLDEVRLPLHILLASRFGELNENQEEMIGAAHEAAGHADEALRFIGRIVDLDAGRVVPRPGRVRPHDLVAPVLAAVIPRLHQAGATLEADVSPLLPHVRADPRQAREAMSLILGRLAGRSAPGTRIRLVAGLQGGFVHLRVDDSSLRADETFPLAQRLLHLQGGSVAARRDGSLVILLPVPDGV